MNEQNEKQAIEEMVCKNCIHYQMCVDTFRKAKQDGDISLIEEEAYFAKADGCDFYLDKRNYRKQKEAEWVMIPVNGVARWRCGNIDCARIIPFGTVPSELKYCPSCGAHMKGKGNED